MEEANREFEARAHEFGRARQLEILVTEVRAGIRFFFTITS